MLLIGSVHRRNDDNGGGGGGGGSGGSGGDWGRWGRHISEQWLLPLLCVLALGQTCHFAARTVVEDCQGTALAALSLSGLACGSRAPRVLKGAYGATLCAA